MQSVNQRETEKNGIVEMHAIYHDKDIKRIGTITRRKETVYKDIHIHVLIKTVEGQDVERQQRLITTAIHRVCQTIIRPQ